MFDSLLQVVYFMTSSGTDPFPPITWGSSFLVVVAWASSKQLLR
jgi:hypothetical protein